MTTHWSVVVTAGNMDSGRAQIALEQLCRAYWFPLYTYIRRRGHSAHDAQDLTQEFFSQLLEKNWVAQADESRGRFRSFLLMVLNRFLANQWKKETAKKRGGAHHHIPLPLDTAESRLASLPSNASTPEHAFEKQWAMTLLDAVLARLRNEFETSGRADQFSHLKPCLTGTRESQPYADLAVELGTTEGAVKVMVHRMRTEYRRLLKEEIACTVASDADIEDELKHLFRVLARG